MPMTCRISLQAALAALLLLVFAVVQTALEGFPQGQVGIAIAFGGLIAIGVVVAALFVFAESRAHEPIVPLQLFRLRTFTASVRPIARS